MSNKLKVKKVPKTIYLDPELVEQIDGFRKGSCRHFSAEVEYMLVKLLKYRNAQNEEAVAMAAQGTQRQG